MRVVPHDSAATGRQLSLLRARKQRRDQHRPVAGLHRHHGLHDPSADDDQHMTASGRQRHDPDDHVLRQRASWRSHAGSSRDLSPRAPARRACRRTRPRHSRTAPTPSRSVRRMRPAMPIRPSRVPRSSAATEAGSSRTGRLIVLTDRRYVRTGGRASNSSMVAVAAMSCAAGVATTACTVSRAPIACSADAATTASAGARRRPLSDAAGRDRFSGDGGNDRIDARNGTAAGRRGVDDVRCGTGNRDIALVDPRDRVSRDCERVTRR